MMTAHSPHPCLLSAHSISSSNDEPESLERHSVHHLYARGIYRHLIHNGLVLQIVAISSSRRLASLMVMTASSRWNSGGCALLMTRRDLATLLPWTPGQTAG